MTTTDADWLDEAARYFEKRPTGGEDMAFWSNVTNAERCRKIAQSLRSGNGGEVSTEDCGKAGDQGDDSMNALDMLDWFRKHGWMVAVHNDYRQHGRLYTFWLMTHSSGRWVKGEGISDALALSFAMADALDIKP